MKFGLWKKSSDYIGLFCDLVGIKSGWAEVILVKPPAKMIKRGFLTEELAF